MNKGMTLEEYQAKVAGTRERLRLTKVALLEYIQQVDDALEQLDVVEEDLAQNLDGDLKDKLPKLDHIHAEPLGVEDAAMLKASMSHHPAGKKRQS